ncbi:hypothetical protein N7501_003614 [Penicillium viridicatum]|nr:hypothetical protein N7501_003614 [Penicillium viridicatum]
MSQIPTPPASRPGSEAPDVKLKPVALEDSVQCLDTLLERYLHLLDWQQKLHSSLAEQLSSGFFALAQANFSSPGRRYGPDYYDGRMKATRKISVQSERNTEQSMNDPQDEEDITALPDSEYTFSVKTTTTPSHPPAEEDGNNETKASSPALGGHLEAEETRPAEAASSETSGHAETETTPVKKPKPVSKKFRSADPIHWYGILVPQSLRRAQDSFANAIDNQVPDLASTTVEMRALEQQISQLRARLEIESSDATVS